MRVETPTLDEFHNDDEQQQKSAVDESFDDGGAAYGQPQTFRAEEPEDAGCCRSCGTPVEDVAQRPSEVRRVWADEHGRVLAGPCCSDNQTFSKAIQGARNRTERARELTAVEAHKREVVDL